jgi:hypothetical protein
MPSRSGAGSGCLGGTGGEGISLCVSAAADTVVAPSGDMGGGAFGEEDDGRGVTALGLCAASAPRSEGSGAPSLLEEGRTVGPSKKGTGEGTADVVVGKAYAMAAKERGMGMGGSGSAAFGL